MHERDRQTDKQTDKQTMERYTVTTYITIGEIDFSDVAQKGTAQCTRLVLRVLCYLYTTLTLLINRLQ